MAENVKYRFIQNVGEYFPAGYFGEDFLEKVQKCAGLDADSMKALSSKYTPLRREYDEYKNFIVNAHPRVQDAIKATHDFNTRLLEIWGYDTREPYSTPYIINDDHDPYDYVPVRHTLYHNGQVRMLVMEMQHLIKVDETEPAGLFEQQYDDGGIVKHQRYTVSQWNKVFQFDPEHYKISPAVINKAITQIFLMPEQRRPHFILLMAGNAIFLFDEEKWARGGYLLFTLDELFSQASIVANRNYYALFHLLLSKETLAGDSETVLMDTIIEESYKNAYEVTKDLKEGVVNAVETLANEALYYKRHVVHEPFGKKNDETGEYDETDDGFEAEVRDDCITIVYRLLFIFFAESRQELNILPTDDEIYNKGYSLEMLRDLEQVRLISEETRNGYFIDDSIRQLFRLLSDGFNANRDDGLDKRFKVRKIDSPLFNDKKLHHLGDVKIRNIKWQEIIKALSLSHRGSNVGRISYANLGVNQLGSVYESLLAYRGFYTEEDYIEVHKAGAPEDGTYLVPYSRMGDFDFDTEVLKNDDGTVHILKRGTFVYRLNGRDRQKSASYYTPEVLTRSTVKYTLKNILDEVAADKRKATELLNLKILEPAMGAAAFQNEIINQLAEAYLEHQQRQLRQNGHDWRIQPDKYRSELQKVKAFIATHNVYGVDLNPTAIELGKLSLWLNVIHKDMDTPFFSNRIALGNAVIGAWLKVYSKDEVYVIRDGKRDIPNKWWEKAPHKVSFNKNSVARSVNEVYHFLLPDANMLAVRSITEQKRQHPLEFNKMRDLIRDWTKPIYFNDFIRLQRISGMIDVLLKEYFTFVKSMEELTDDRKQIWGIIKDNNRIAFDTYDDKERLFNTRYRRDNAYYRLKLVMDYWCSLWFWEYDEAADLPTRDEYWDDIEALLNVSDDQLDSRTRQAIGKAKIETPSLFESDTQSEEESDIILKSKEEILLGVRGDHNLFSESYRFKNVKRYADRYHFFHPMLEFLEVFWLRDGFDIICGNPPWIKLEFASQGIIAEKYPEVEIRRMAAPQVKEVRDRLFKAIPALEQSYREEETENAGTVAFLNAFANYPLLKGQQTNLYKCILENGLGMMNTIGYMGVLTPETIYDDPNGQPLRKEIYKRLRYHFQYENELTLFSEVHHNNKFGENIFGCEQNVIDFESIHNLYHPNTIDICFGHDGHGTCGGIKTEEGKWNTVAHRDRIVNFREKELRILSDAFEDGADWESVKLTSIHANSIIDVLQTFSRFPHHVSDFGANITVDLDETGAVNSGVIARETFYPTIENYEMVYNGPQIYVANPSYKTPRETCRLNSDYDNINLELISDNFIARSNYRPLMSKDKFVSLINGFVYQDENGDEAYDNWIDYYKVGFRKMLSINGERSLICAVLPRKTAHINGVISATFRSGDNTVDMAALCASLPMDAYMKIMASQNLTSIRMLGFPLGVDEKYNNALRSRTLMLNCITNFYSELWKEVWSESYRHEQWSIIDSRLHPFDTLSQNWDHETPLRNHFERRQALIEIDVISAMALGLNLHELETIYNIYFPVLQQNENDTWYDAEGKIVFTCSKGLTGIGLDRKGNARRGIVGWEDIRGEEIVVDGKVMGYKGTTPTHVHTIDPAKSELYGGQQQTFVAPYTRCDRIADYRRAWSHFDKIFNNQ